MSATVSLKRVLSPAMVWGLGVGYVISGNYFGWNLGLAQGGTLGLAIATVVVIIMYVTFTFSYAELACAIPKAGGAFDYASRSLGEDVGFFAGMAQNIEFVFAQPAIALAIGSYLHLFFPAVPVIAFSAFAYVVFSGLNIYGIQAAARVELVVTVIAVLGLLLFAGAVLPHAEFKNLSYHALPNGWAGIFAAVPFAIWFFLGIEGVANLAEEAIDPRRSMSVGFLSALFTLICICLLTFTGAVGLSGWESVVFDETGGTSDAPLPLAIAQISTKESSLHTTVIVAGLFGLVASFNGLMLAAGRSCYEFAKAYMGSRYIGKISARFQTPVNALGLNLIIGFLALLTGRTGDLITLSVFGALTLYAISMIAMMRLREKEPSLNRPFKSPGYPYTPWIALVIALVALVALIVYNPMLSIFYVTLLTGSFGIFKLLKH